jgi:hypothetical protein
MAAKVLTPNDLATVAIACGVLPQDSPMTEALLEFTKTIVGHCISVAQDGLSDGKDLEVAIRERFGF